MSTDLLIQISSSHSLALLAGTPPRILDNVSSQGTLFDWNRPRIRGTNFSLAFDKPISRLSQTNHQKHNIPSLSFSLSSRIFDHRFQTIKENQRYRRYTTLVVLSFLKSRASSSRVCMPYLVLRSYYSGKRAGTLSSLLPLIAASETRNHP